MFYYDDTIEKNKKNLKYLIFHYRNIQLTIDEKTELRKLLLFYVKHYQYIELKQYINNLKKLDKITNEIECLTKRAVIVKEMVRKNMKEIHEMEEEKIKKNKPILWLSNKLSKIPFLFHIQH